LREPTFAQVEHATLEHAPRRPILAFVTDRFVGKADWFESHYESTRGRVRLSLVQERLRSIIPAPPARILDAGGGTGAFAVPLAKEGYNVTHLFSMTFNMTVPMVGWMRLRGHGWRNSSAMAFPATLLLCSYWLGGHRRPACGLLRLE
jgi:hypothetical protein